MCITGIDCWMRFMAVDLPPEAGKFADFVGFPQMRQITALGG